MLIGGNNSTPAANTPNKPTPSVFPARPTPPAASARPTPPVAPAKPTPPVFAVSPSLARYRPKSPSQYGLRPDPEPKSNATTSQAEPQNKSYIEIRVASAAAKPNLNDNRNIDKNGISSSVVSLRVEETELENVLHELFVLVLDEMLIDRLEVNVGITCDGCQESNFSGYKCCL